MVNTRRIEILKDGEWVECKQGLVDLAIDDQFKMYEVGTEDPVTLNGCAVFRAMSKPYLCEGIWSIDGEAACEQTKA